MVSRVPWGNNNIMVHYLYGFFIFVVMGYLQS
jgi:hypothetical protein